MLKKVNRGLSPDEVSAIITGGKTFSNHFVRVFALRSDSSPTRFAVLLAKRMGMKGVDRNRIRRGLYCAVEAHWLNFELPLGIVVLAKSSCLGLKSAQLCSKVGEVLRRVFTDV